MKHDRDAGEPGSRVARARDKLLFTPGPLTTSRTVKQAMLTDLGSRDREFIDVIADVRRRLLAIGHADPDRFTTIPMQGAGTFGLESVVGSAIPSERALLVVVNGAYGRRLVSIAERLGIETQTLEYEEDRRPDPADVRAALAGNPNISMVSACHCETTSGILNPVAEIGQAAHEAGRHFFVDAMSAYGAIDLDVEESHIDFVCSSANKCIEGVPGFSFIVARKAALEETEGSARSVALDLHAQVRGLDANGQFRFTPPVQAILAFHQALVELEHEGGVEARHARYRANHETLVAGMRELGFSEYVPSEAQSPIITSFLYPSHENWDFDRFYRLISEEGHIIYPGKAGEAPCFRIGTIGRIYPADVRALIGAIRRALDRMGVDPAESAPEQSGGIA